MALLGFHHFHLDPLPPFFTHSFFAHFPIFTSLGGNVSPPGALGKVFPHFRSALPLVYPFFFAKVGYAQLKHYDVLDDLYNWEDDLQESLEVAADDLAADPMEEDEDVPQMEGEVQEEHTTTPAKHIYYDIHGFYTA